MDVVIAMFFSACKENTATAIVYPSFLDEY